MYVERRYPVLDRDGPAGTRDEFMRTLQPFRALFTEEQRLQCVSIEFVC